MIFSSANRPVAHLSLGLTRRYVVRVQESEESRLDLSLCTRGWQHRGLEIGPGHHPIGIPVRSAQAGLVFFLQESEESWLDPSLCVWGPRHRGPARAHHLYIYIYTDHSI